jgi:hypothetical protein
MIPDGCGHLIDCGGCSGGKTCGGGCVPNVCDFPIDGACECTPVTCAQKGVNCGDINDGCGNLVNCGTCPSPLVCGGGGTPGVCGCTGTCTPKTCADVGANCGTVDDGCGTPLDCGTCPAPQTCGGLPGSCFPQPNVCG